MTADEKERKTMPQEMFATQSTQARGASSHEETATKDHLFEDLLQRAAAFLSGQQPLASQSN